MRVHDIGKGCFGDISLAKFHSTTVAMKTGNTMEPTVGHWLGWADACSMCALVQHGTMVGQCCPLWQMLEESIQEYVLHMETSHPNIVQAPLATPALQDVGEPR